VHPIAPKEVMIKQNTLSNRSITRYDYTTVKPSSFTRLIRFFKAVLAARRTSEHGLSNAMEARLYL